MTTKREMHLICLSILIFLCCIGQNNGMIMSSLVHRNRISYPNIKLQKYLKFRGGGGITSSSHDEFDGDYKSEFTFGKDRELFHASIDLKWVYFCLTDRGTWLNLAKGLLEKIKRLYPPYDILCYYRENALEMIKNFRNLEEQSNLKVFQGTLLQAQYYSLITDRPILFYSEELIEGIVPTFETLFLRKTLTNPVVEDTINKEFIFLASTANHPYTTTLIRESVKQEKLPSSQPVEYPLIFVVVPKLSMKDYHQMKIFQEQNDIGSIMELMKRRNYLDLEVFALYYPIQKPSSSSSSASPHHSQHPPRDKQLIKSPEQLNQYLEKILKQIRLQREMDYEEFRSQLSL